jgi:hypothetical protein
MRLASLNLTALRLVADPVVSFPRDFHQEWTRDRPCRVDGQDPPGHKTIEVSTDGLGLDFLLFSPLDADVPRQPGAVLKVSHPEGRKVGIASFDRHKGGNGSWISEEGVA